MKLAHSLVGGIVSCLCMSGGVCAQAPSSPQKQPQPAQAAPVVIEPASIDFGKVPPGSKHPAKFSIRNVSAMPLTIKSVVPSCKCTDVNVLAGSVIVAGAAVELLATLDVPGTPGEKEAKVFITFEGYPAPVMAMLKADASLAVRSTPAYIDALKKVTSGTLSVAAADGKPFRIVTAGGVAPVFVDFDTAKDEPRSSYTLRWTASTATCEEMPLWWVVETDRVDCPLVPLRVRHECTGSRADPTKATRYWFIPEPLGVAGRVAVGQSVVLPITIEHYNAAGRGAVVRPEWSQVLAVRSLSPQLVASLEGVRPGNKEDVAVLVRVAPAEGVSGIVYGLIEIETTTGRGSVAVSMQATASATQ